MILISAMSVLAIEFRTKMAFPQMLYFPLQPWPIIVAGLTVSISDKGHKLVWI